MGILRGQAALMIEFHEKNRFSGSVLQLGRQDIFISLNDIRRISAKLGSTAIDPSLTSSIQDSDRRLSDREFFRLFSFDDVQSMDLSEVDGDIVHDLNDPDLPAELHNRFDCVVDGGTIEHVFHVPNVLANIHKLLKDDGRIIHWSPTSNFVEHGFYSFSPTLFLDYYKSNGYEVEACYLIDLGTKLWNTVMTAYDCRDGLERPLIDGFLTGHPYTTFVIARKAEGATCDKIPIQGYYANHYAALRTSRADEESADSAGSSLSLLGIIKALIKRNSTVEYWVRYYSVPIFRAGVFWRSRRYLRRLAKRVPG